MHASPVTIFFFLPFFCHPTSVSGFCKEELFELLLIAWLSPNPHLPYLCVKVQQQKKKKQ
jgi:hypothetical protein